MIEPTLDTKIRPEVREKINKYLSKLKAHHKKTYQHSIRVGGLASKVGKAEGLDALLLQEMGLLHDVGKIVVNPAYLSLNGITPEQYAAVKVHARAGYKILEDELPYAAYAAGNHHPKYAVKECPKSLTGCLILEEYTSIITLCDFYDALTTRKNKQFSNVNINDSKQVEKLLGKEFEPQIQRIKTLIGTAN